MLISIHLQFAYSINTELPGFPKDSINVSVFKNFLTIEGHREDDVKEETDAYRKRERVTGSVKRVVSLPTDIDDDKTEAEFRDGVLTVTLPKAPNARTGGKPVPIH